MGHIDPIDVAYIIKYHKDLINQNPNDHDLSMGWSGDTQAIRFKHLANIDDLNNK